MAPDGAVHGEGWVDKAYPSSMTDQLSEQYGDLLDGSYDCVDRIVLTARSTSWTRSGDTSQIKMSGHPPFGAQVILNGHEYVACQARRAGINFMKEGNCFTKIADAAGLARVADTLSELRAIGRLTQVCERWIYTVCLCFALDLEEQRRTGFRYQYSVYQAEYSRNLLFQVGGQMEQVFQRMVDRTRPRLDVARLKTIFGAKVRPHRDRQWNPNPRLAVVVETPR